MINYITVIFVVEIVVVHSIYCGSDQRFVQRGYYCCRPVYNCIPGYEVKSCTSMYGSETCQKCEVGYVQPDYIDSFSENRTCFEQREECIARDLVPSRGRHGCYPKYCKCNTANCFIDDHCVCVKHRGCPINQTLDPLLGDCVKCPKYTYKNHYGCGPCITDVVLIRLQIPTNSENEIPSTDFFSVEQDQHNRKSAAADNETHTTKRKQRKKCKRCSKWKTWKNIQNPRKRQHGKKKYRKCKRIRRRCLGRNLKNKTERQ